MSNAAPRPRSRRASTPAKAEAFSEPITFEYADVEYEIPASDDWSIDALEALDTGKAISAVRELLGTVQWRTFRSKHSTARELGELSEALAKAAGLGN